jgi:ATP-dependent RNA helicase DDX5/DBP2
MPSDDEKTKKKMRKEALKAEAEKKGLTYHDLKHQKKDSRQKKRTLESTMDDVADHEKEQTRMRSWSHEFDEGNAGHKINGDEPESSKRRRTRSMDSHENQGSSKISVSSDEWRLENNISIQGHGKRRGDVVFPDPFLTFRDSPFVDAVMKTFERAGYTAPTPIQSQAWPIALKGIDMICIAKTGSGKTCGFLLPSLHQHTSHRRTGPKKPALLVLAPTRELACQIMDETRKFGWPLGCNAVCCYGGSSKGPQIAMFERGVDCIIATPGRINDLLEMKKVDLSHVKFLVLDEADRMLDMGFEPQIRSVIKHVPESRQTLLFSATWPKEIQRLAHDFLKDPIQVNVGEVDALVANKDITQNIVMCTEDDKFDKLIEILGKICKKDPGADKGSPMDHPKVIVFTAKKISCNDLANQLWDAGFAVDSLHGDRPQWERTKVINAFKDGALRMLIATDVAARGLDVKDVAVVINYDMPAGSNAVEDYVHRIGRTGRAGQKGEAFTFFTSKDKKCANELIEVLKKAGQDIPAELAMMVRPKFGPGGRGGSGRGYMSGRAGGRGYMSPGRGGSGRSFYGHGGGRFSSHQGRGGMRYTDR